MVGIERSSVLQIWLYWHASWFMNAKVVWIQTVTLILVPCMYWQGLSGFWLSGRITSVGCSFVSCFLILQWACLWHSVCLHFLKKYLAVFRSLSWCTRTLNRSSFLTHVSIILIYVMSHVCLLGQQGWPSVLHGKNYNVGHYIQTAQQFSSCLPCL